MSTKIKKKSETTKAEKNWSNGAVYFFTAVLLVIFPLFYHNYYFDILPAKYAFYWITVLLMTLTVVIYLVSASVKSGNWKPDWTRIKAQLSVPDICMLVLLLGIIISTFQSDYFYESFWGNEARYNGMFLWMIYGLAYVIITRLLKFKSRLLDWFLFAGALACLFGITDYFQMDILHFKETIRPDQSDIFVSTFGNINVYTAYVGMVAAVATVLFTTAKTKGRMIGYGIVMVISYYGMITGRSDNGYLAIGAIFALLPFCLFATREGVRRYVSSLAILCTCIWSMRIVNDIWSKQVLYLDSAFGMMSESNSFIYVVAALWILVGLLCILDRKKSSQPELGKWPRIVWAAFLGLCALILIYVLYDANIAGNVSRYEKIANYVVFNDSWGTDRGFEWRISMRNFKEFPIVRKLFGYGPDTFGIITNNNNFNEMLDYNNTIFESAHNEYIHYLLTIGLIGTVSYIMLLVTSCVRMIKKAAGDPYIMAIVFAVTAYAAQAVVNIAQPLITPIMFTLLMAGLAGCRKREDV